MDVKHKYLTKKNGNMLEALHVVLEISEKYIDRN